MYIYIYIYIYLNTSTHLQQNAYKYIDVSMYIPTGHNSFLTRRMLYSMLPCLNQGHHVITDYEIRYIYICIEVYICSKRHMNTLTMSTYIRTGHICLYLLPEGCFIPCWILGIRATWLHGAEGHIGPGQETAHGHLALARKQPWTPMTWQA